MGSVFEGFNDAREGLASDLADFALDYQRSGFYATGPGKSFQNIGEFVSSELFEAIHGDPTNTRTAHFLNATGDFISDWWNNKESTIASAKDYWQTAGNSLSDFIAQTDGKTLGHMAGHAVGDALFQVTTGSLAAKGVAMGAQGLGDLVSQAATFIGKADKNPDARKALEQLAAEGKIDTSAPVKTGAGDGTMSVEGGTGKNSAATPAHNAANFALQKEFLSVTESANPLVESLRNTGQLPSNYVTKAQAVKQGWKPGKALGNSVPNGQIGGDVFQNATNILPSTQGRIWYEADIGINSTMTRANQPGTRLLYSNDGLLYVTADHYETVHIIGRWKD